LFKRRTCSGFMAFSDMLAFFAWCVISSAFGETNVYDQPMSTCGTEHASGCTYAAYDAGAHQVCVTQLPHGFSSDTGQGPWSDEFTGQHWCICIWAYSNYILQNKDLPLKCDAIPAKVLEGGYSLDKFKQCGSMSSSEGCGAEDIRRSIQSLCQQCGDQAADNGSKSALKAKCDAILASAPAAPMQRLFLVNKDWKSMSWTQIARSVSPSALVLCGFAIAAASVAMFVRTLRHRANLNPQSAQE